MSFLDKIKNIFSKQITKEKANADIDALKNKYKDLLRNCIGVKIGSAAEEGSLTLFGGLPLTPKNFEWPYFETDSLDDSTGEVKPRPLAFLAQFDCSKFAEHDKDNILPHTGVLSFFYSVESNRWGFAPEDAGCSRVYWFENVNELVTANFPEDLAEDYRFPSLAIKLAAEQSYPDYEELPQEYDSDEYEEFFEAIHTDDDENMTKLLGWADTIQSEMETECELVTNNHYLGDSGENIPQEARDEAERTARDKWQLLLQMDTVESGDFELMFGDCGRIYFWIKKEDLAARRFDKVWLILQCY